jgi:hypothetical protein
VATTPQKIALCVPRRRCGCILVTFDHVCWYLYSIPGQEASACVRGVLAPSWGGVATELKTNLQRRIRQLIPLPPTAIGPRATVRSP